MSIASTANEPKIFRTIWKVLSVVPLLTLPLNLNAQDSHPPAQPLQTAPATPAHPLDPLTPNEFTILKDILQKQGKLSDKTIYNWVQLQEPPKKYVLEFQSGQVPLREAQVVAVSPEKKTAYEILVNLNSKTIDSVKDLGNLQPSLAGSEFRRAKEIVDDSPKRAQRWRNAVTISKAKYQMRSFWTRTLRAKTPFW
jgi:Cu2+-containing amine oxidase